MGTAREWLPFDSLINLPVDDSNLKCQCYTVNPEHWKNSVLQVGFEPKIQFLDIYIKDFSIFRFILAKQLFGNFSRLTSWHSASTRMTANASVDASMPVLVQEPECVPVSIWSENRLSFMPVYWIINIMIEVITLVKQLFHSCLLDMTWLKPATSYPTCPFVE